MIRRLLYLTPILLPLTLEAQLSTTIDRTQPGPNGFLAPSFASAKSIAVNRSGHTFVLAQWNGNGTELRLYRSIDFGKTFALLSRVRTPHAIRGSMVLGPDGHQLHVTWGVNPPNRPDSIWYGRFDTRFSVWVGRDFEVFRGGLVNQDWFWPDIDVTPKGYPVIVASGGRGYAWRGSMRYFDGMKWSNRKDMSVNRTGVCMNVAADHRGQFHLAYRSLPVRFQPSHIIYRRFDPITATLTPEVSVAGDTSNICSMAIDSVGNRHLLLARDGKLVLASATAGSDQFTQRVVTRDAGYSSANTNYNYYALGLADGTPWCYYAHSQRGFKEIFVRGLIGDSLTPEFLIDRLDQGVVSAVGAFHSNRVGLQQAVVWTVLDPAEKVYTLRARTTITGTVAFGEGCPDSMGRRARIRAHGAPVPGNRAFSIELRNAPPRASGSLLLGDSHVRYRDLPLPLDLGFLGMPGCFLYQNTLTAVPFLTSAAGTWQARLPVPNHPAVHGVRVLAQGFVRDELANVAGLVSSASMAMFIQ